MFGSSSTGGSCRRAAFIALTLVLAVNCGGDDGDGVVAPASVIRVDGEVGEWQRAPGVQRLTTDPRGDGRDQMSQTAAIAAEADLLSVSAAHDGERLYFLLELAAARPVDRQVEYAVYIDADGKTATGYVVGDDAVGADFVIINGSLLRHDSTERTEWKWATLDWKVEELESGAEGHAVELSVDRRAIQMAGAGVTSLGLLFTTIEPHDTSMWEDNVTDFSPEQNGRPGRVEYRLSALGPPPTPVAPSKPKVAGIRNYLLYYGAWDRSIIDKVIGYDLLILDAHRGPRPSQIAPVVRRIRAGVNGIPGDDDDVIVLSYISLGEDVRTFGNAPEEPGDGRGPATWDVATEQLVYQQRGVASFYLDEKSGEEELPGADGLADRQGTWGACFVNPGDPAWQSFLIGKDGRAGVPYSAELLINGLGYQGLFLDTPEVADPWHGYGYTAQGMYEAIRAIRESFPTSVLLLNRGVFFFVPQFPLQFQWNPRKFIDIGLFESHYLDSDYGEGEAVQPYHLSPFFDVNSAFFDQKIQAELGRTDDSFELMLSLDYAADPDALPLDHPDVFDLAIASSLQEYGRIPLITTRLVDATPFLTLQHPLPEDVEPPRWGNTTVGFATFLPVSPPAFMIAGNEDRQAKAPRVGVQKAIPGNGQVTLRWDVALDQTLPVHYNVYYSDVWPFDLAQATVLRDVPTEMAPDYVDRGMSSADDGSPYQHTVSGLENGRTYFFVVRAEDSTRGGPGGGPVGPRGGLEDQNLNVVATAPRETGAKAGIEIDGAFEDWEAVPAFPDRLEEAAGLTVDWLEARVTEDDAAYYVLYETAEPVSAAGAQQIFINTDGLSWTGLQTRGGADFLVRSGKLHRYGGSGTDELWVAVGAVEMAQADWRVEMRLAKASLVAEGEGPVFNFLGTRTAGVADAMPDFGLGFRLPVVPPEP